MNLDAAEVVDVAVLEEEVEDVAVAEEEDKVKIAIHYLVQMVM